MAECCYDAALMINPIEEKQTMPITAKWIFTAAMDVDPDKEAIFNEV